MPREKDPSILHNLKVSHLELLDSLNVGFMLGDGNFRFLNVNKTFLKMTGLKREDVVGHHTSKIYSQKDFNQLKKIVLAGKKHDDYQFEFTLPTANGENIPVVHNCHLNRDNKGRVVSVYVTVTDIREQKKAQMALEAANRALYESQERLEKEIKMKDAILFGIGDCVTVFDQKGAFLFSNPQGLEVRKRRRTPFLPLQADKQHITLKTKGKEKQFICQVQEIRDQNGSTWAYIETLNDITSQIMLQERENELTRIKRELGRNHLSTRMIGVSKAMENIFEMILRSSEVDSNVLILGETGVGKEIAARAIHSQSSHKKRPFVGINCGALPENLLESELFGHVKGAFTDAKTDRVGLFREANGGTLFLDEIGELNTNLQVKLLRVLQEKEVRPVGSDKAYPFDVRIIAATNRNIEESIQGNQLRSDLYYRLAVIPIIIPPLRDRKEDIIPLAEHFIKKYRKGKNRSQLILDHAIQEKLMNYHWPGNIRELENAVEHCLAMARDDVLAPESLPVHILNKQVSQAVYKETATTLSLYKEQLPVDNKPLPGTSINLGDSEKNTILNALNHHKWNRTLTAKDLGICRTTLWRKIAKYDLTDHLK